ncbi:retron St85 family RNA-directed DNA polymerase [Sporosarcina limicola]|uniref:RNA-directed DNA polymerase n=1 Tax=Sporosarcina limicola TaxID=34101 RepID=A0A927MKI6_9BACL|nr:retron St85 family RNA-directed DNA polymerase [Sporosarcina limicola]MBE1556283.1 RNA-directed DNA polymerase [Sporosarcina limicola]
MNWEVYRDNFYSSAKTKGYKENYINRCLEYSKILFDQKLPIIYDQKHLSLLIGYQEIYLIKVSNSQEPFYREFKIPKKNKNEFRKIHEPLPNLKNIQRWILEEILNILEPSPYSKGFRKGYSIKDNARFHKKQKKVLSIDIENYFGSISYDMVYSFFRNLGYSKQVSVMLANLCVLEGRLPQGSPTSPMLSNLITKRLDNRIGGYAKKRGIRYTRYADDLTFSGDFNEGALINFVKNVFESEGFVINEKKTRVRLQSQQQEVTGIVVNEKMQASRKYRREFRTKMFFIKKYGLDSHLDYVEEEKKIEYVYHLLGTANFIVNVNPNDLETREHYIYLKELLSDLKKS